MTSTSTSPMIVQKLFRSLLSETASTTPPQRPAVSAATTAPPPRLLSSPPQKNSIRYIENDQNNRREKYDGCRWRLACTWGEYACSNLAYNRQLCGKHNAARPNKESPKKKRKPLLVHLSLPIMGQQNQKNASNEDDDDIEIIEEACVSSNIRHSLQNNVKTEGPDFAVFSVDHLDDPVPTTSIKSEPTSSSSYQASSTNEIQYITSKVRSNGLNIEELVAKNIPPLTEFEEECLGYRLMERLSANCLMLDAQLFLHREAIAAVQKNYRLKMDTVAPEYFYDFLLRNPRLALHYRNWFSQCKPVPPSTGCSIDTKVWTLSMIVRGATTNDR